VLVPPKSSELFRLSKRSVPALLLRAGAKRGRFAYISAAGARIAHKSLRICDRFRLEDLQRAPVLAFAAAIGRLATTLALARVLAFATVVTVLATALTLTLVLSLATVLTFLVICHRLQRNAHFRARARGVGTHHEGSG
jgi:hypothetical protein